jgi:hypothetical protein
MVLGGGGRCRDGRGAFLLVQPRRRLRQCNGCGVDQSNGNVYVSDFMTNRLWEFKVNLAGKSAEPEMAFGGAGWVREPLRPSEPQRQRELNVPFQPAVDGAHNVLVPTLNDGEVSELSPAGEEIVLASPITGLAEPTGVGVDGGGNIYVSQLGGAVRKFNPALKPRVDQVVGGDRALDGRRGFPWSAR